MTRVRALDGLRGIAILLVVLSHVSLIGTNGGAIGVTLFFVLSGYLITNLLLKEHRDTQHVDLIRFYARRSYRLLPALIVFLIGIGAVMSLIHKGFPVWQTTWPPLMYVSNYAQLAEVNVLTNHHTWSLAVEEHFYLLWPLLLMSVPATRRVRPLAAGIVLLVGWRLLIGLVDARWAYLSTDTNAYALGIGCLLAVATFDRPAVAMPKWSTEASILGLLGLSLLGQRQLSAPEVWVPVLASVLAAAAVVGAAQSHGSILENPVLRFFGAISYGWYLWHAPLLLYPTTNDTVGQRLSIAVGSLVIAWLSLKLVEQPFLRFRDRRNSQVEPELSLSAVGSSSKA